MIEVLPHQPGDVDRTCADISKARELLGYEPKVPFEEGIRRTAEWFREATELGLFEDPLNTSGDGLTERDRAGSLISLVSVSSGRSSPSVDHEALAAAAVVGTSGTDELGDSSSSPSAPSGVIVTTGPGRYTAGIADAVFSPVLARPTGARTYHNKRHLFVHKISSDLELSSYVQKAPTQVRNRVNRLL